jgi:gallate dioxygenase
MAEVIAGLGCSHAPSIAHAWDDGRTEHPEWSPLFASLDRARDWLTELAPDALVVIYNDHFNSFFLDALPTFTLGVDDAFEIAAEGGSPRDLPPVPGHAGLAEHLAREMVAEGIDLTVCRHQEVDHGVLAPLPVINRGWAFPIVPININVVFEPVPSPRRCWEMGQAIRAAIESYPEPLRVVVFGTGGLSHQLSGPSFGRVTAEWDREFMRLVAEEPEALPQLTLQQLAERGGEQSVEVVQWIAMRGALPSACEVDFAFYYPRQIMGYAVAAYRPSTTN